MGKAGQRKAHRKNIIPFLGRKSSCAQTIHWELFNLEKLTELQLQFWAEYQFYLANQRELLIDEITNELRKSLKPFQLGGGSRIVDAKYQSSPLDSTGSVIVPPGGRFNFGNISSYYQNFRCLYIASNFDTAFAEKYGVNVDSADGSVLAPEEFYLQSPSSFSHYRVNLSLCRIIDVRDESNLEGFCNVISTIKPTDAFKARYKKLGFKDELKTIQTGATLKKALHERNYQQWSVYTDHPSPSQWFGHYSRLAGIQAILYQSTKFPDGFNLAIFPDQLSADCFVALADSTAVPVKQQRISGPTV